MNGRQLDILIVNCHKQYGWGDHLARKIRMLVCDKADAAIPVWFYTSSAGAVGDAARPTLRPMCRPYGRDCHAAVATD
jgi:hypothetical protein